MNGGLVSVHIKLFFFKENNIYTITLTILLNNKYDFENEYIDQNFNTYTLH